MRRREVEEGFVFVERWLAANGGPGGRRSQEAEGMLATLDLEVLSGTYLRGVVQASGLVGPQLMRDVSGRKALRFDQAFEVEAKFGSQGTFEEVLLVAVHGEGARERVAAVDEVAQRVLVFSVDTGQCTAVAGAPGPGKLRSPVGVAFNARGELLVSDAQLHQVLVYDAEEGTYLRSFGGEGSGEGQLQFPRGLACTAGGDVVVVDGGNDRLQVLREEDGAFLRSVGSKGHGEGELFEPTDVAVAPDGSLVVADSGNHRVQVFDAAGGFVRSFGGYLAETAPSGESSEGAGAGGGDGMFLALYGVAVGGGGHILAADPSRQDVQVFTSEGAFLQAIGARSAARPRKSGVDVGAVQGVCVDGLGRVFAGCGLLADGVLMLSS